MQNSEDKESERKYKSKAIIASFRNKNDEREVMENKKKMYVPRNRHKGPLSTVINQKERLQ